MLPGSASGGGIAPEEGLICATSNCTNVVCRELSIPLLAHRKERGETAATSTDSSGGGARSASGGGVALPLSGGTPPGQLVCGVQLPASASTCASLPLPGSASGGGIAQQEPKRPNW